MAKAIWNGAVLAESDTFELVEGNVYFPPESLNKEYFEESDSQTICSWKGVASYYHLVVDGQRNKDAAWYYPNPRPKAREIKDLVAFWRGVKVEK